MKVIIVKVYSQIIHDTMDTVCRVSQQYKLLKRLALHIYLDHSTMKFPLPFPNDLEYLTEIYIFHPMRHNYFVLTGGYIAFLIGLQSIGDGKTKTDASMQKLHDGGKWEWKIKRIIENYHNPETPDAITQGLQYAFRITANSE